MTMIQKAFTNVTPVTDTFDFNSATQLTGIGPFWVSLSGWVETADAGAGILVFGIRYRDPSGVDRDLNFNTTTNLSLVDPDGSFTTAVCTVIRESGSSMWELNSTLVGSAGTSKVSYRIVVSPNDDSEPLPFGEY